MTFLYPAFAWAFLSLGVILFLYLLKRRYEDMPVPSTFLWRKTALDMTASRPFQRLRRNLLLPLHLLMAAVLALLLMRPILPGGMAGEVVMIFDLSASMQAQEQGRTRLAQAVSHAQELLDGMGAEDTLTILAADGETRQLLARSTDREEARRVLASLKPSNQTCDLSAAVSLARAMQREMDGLQILVFSDDYIPEPSIAVHNAARGLDNRAVTSFAVENGAGYARVINYGAACDVTLACYAEETLCDARTLHVPAGQSAGVSFSVPPCAYARVVIQETDALAVDNTRWFVPKTQKRYTVSLSGEGSVFLEHALTLREDIALVKTSDAERAAVSADLYICGTSPLLFSRSAEPSDITALPEAFPEGALTLAQSDPLTAGLTLSGVAVRAFRPLSGGRTLMTIDGQSVMRATEHTVALGFDIHDTNLPMKYDFPILIQNVLRYFLPETAADVGEGVCGEGIRMVLPADGSAAMITTPGGRLLHAADMTDWSLSAPFEDTAEAGLYTLTVEGGATAGQRYFALHAPLSESDVRSVAPSVDAAGSSKAPAGGRDLTGVLLMLFLALLMLEWGVSRRGV